MVSAALLLLVGAGVLSMMDRGSDLSGEQRLLATAANVAQSEQERLRGLPVTTLSGLRENDVPRTVNGVVFTSTSRADWVSDATPNVSCATADASADYMKLTTTVTYPTIGTRKPVVLESLVAPPARAFGVTQGSLTVRIRDRLEAPVAGIALSLTGPRTLSYSTSAAGCVLFGYLPAGGGYTVTGSKAGYVERDGSTTLTESPSVTGGQSRTETYDYDRAGAIRATFTTKRSSTAASTITEPQKAMIEHLDTQYVDKSFPVTGNTLASDLVLYPFAGAYEVYAGACVAAKPPFANLASVIAPPGATSSDAAVQLPALNILVRNSGVNVANAVVKVTSCSTTTYVRSTTATGLINDPGFPWGTVDVCVSNGVRKRVIAGVVNKTYPATAVTYDIGTTGSTTGACP
jgi:hypothetical protein